MILFRSEDADEYKTGRTARASCYKHTGNPVIPYLCQDLSRKGIWPGIQKERILYIS